MKSSILLISRQHSCLIIFLDGDEPQERAGSNGAADQEQRRGGDGGGGGGHLSTDSILAPSEASRQVTRSVDSGTVRVADLLRASVSPRASPREGRKDLTISSLIAECEEYVQTDKFTKDLSHELVTLFKAEKPPIASPPAQRASPKVVADPAPMPPGGQADGRPPRIPDTMRTRSSPKLDRNEKIATPKFPLTLRGSTYDNVGESEPEDEGIENDYSDDSGTGGPVVQCNQCVLGGCSQHESSPALTNTSEGYDSAQETGEL